MAISYTTGYIPNRLPVRSDLPAPEATGWSKRAIDELGERASCGLGYQPGSDFQSLAALVADRLKGEVLYGPVDRTGSTGFLEVPESGDGGAPSRFRIVLSPYPGEYRNRFTIAHELGHYFLHSKAGQQPLYATRQAGSRPEWEANWFAAAFLMPATLFVEQWNGCEGRIGHLINRFQVSGGAIEIRRDTLKEFGHELT